VPLPRPRSASEARNSMWARMQATQGRGPGAVDPAKVLFEEDDEAA